MTCSRVVYRAVVLAALLLGLVGAVVRADEPKRAQFGLRPVYANVATAASQGFFILDARPGAVIAEDGVRVTNAGDAEGSVRLYSVDGTTAAASGAVYRNEQEPREDVGAWMTLGARELTLKPGESQVVPLTVTIPADPRPGQHLGGIVAENATIAEGQSSGLQVNVKSLTIIAMQITLPGPTIEHVTASGVTSGGTDGHQQLLLGLRNDGTVMLKPTGTLHVKDARGQQIQTLAFTMDTFIPQTSIDYPVAVEKQALDAGDYEATITLTYGNGQESHATLPFTISPAQVAQVFPTSQLPAATLAPPHSAPGTPPLATGPAGNGAPPRGTAHAMPAWLLVAGAAGGGIVLLALVGGAFMLGRRKRR